MVLGIIFAAPFIYAVLSGMNYAAVGAAITSANYIFLPLGLVSMAIGYVTRSARWRCILFKANPRLPLSLCCVLLVGSFSLNNIFPARAGDVLRIFAFKRHLGVGTATIAGSVMLERVMDLMTLAGFLLLGLCLSSGPGLPEIIDHIMRWTAGVILFFGFVVLVCARAFRAMSELYCRHGGALRKRVLGFCAEALSCSDVLFDIRRLSTVALFSMLAWIGELGLYLCVAWSLSMDIGIAGLMLSMSVANLATLIPGTPGHLGTFHYFAAMAAVAAGSGNDHAIAFAILVHFLSWSATTVAGLAMLAKLNWHNVK